ncbi:MAG: uracil-xanthine permease family protein [Thiolinea sp.]
MNSIQQTINRLFPAFTETPRTKPDNMLYVAEESPDAVTGIVAAGQHAIVVLMMVVFTVICGQESGLSDNEIRGFVALEIVLIGLLTFFQAAPTRFSSGHLIVHTPNVVTIASFAAAATTFGLGAAAGGLIVSGIVVIALSQVLPRLRTLFPPEVAGVLLLLLGFSMVEGGVTRFTGLTEQGIEGSSIIVSTVTLLTIVGLSVWTAGKIKLFAMLAGTLVGLLTAVLLGKFGATELANVQQQPFFAMPSAGYDIPTPTFVLAAILPILMIELITAIDCIGSGVAIDKMNNSKWLRADLPMIGRILTTQGIGVFLAGILGTLSLGTSSANLGLAHASGVAARRVGMMAGVLVLVLAFLPKVAAFIVAIPQPVVGVIIIYTAAYIMVSGMELIFSRMMNTRRMLMVGISTVVGSVVIVMPEIMSGAPSSLLPMLTSALTVGGLCAVALNALFRLGVAQSAKLTLNGVSDVVLLTEFLEKNGAAWGARRDVISKAGMAMGETLEKLGRTQENVWPLNITATFDEYNLCVDLRYQGEKLVFGQAEELDFEALLDAEDDDGLDRIVSNVSGVLMHQLADQVDSKQDGDFATLTLNFEH